jgi:hypothetical protein
MSVFEIATCILLMTLSVGEFIVWDLEMLWHKSEPEVDPRNWTPPR